MTLEVVPGSVWIDDVGSKYLIDRVEGDWVLVFVNDPRAPKRSRALNEIPLAWFARPGWEQIAANGRIAEVLLEEEELWMLYDFVASRAEEYDRAELVAMQGLGGQPYRDLRDKLKRALRVAVND